MTLMGLVEEYEILNQVQNDKERRNDKEGDPPLIHESISNFTKEKYHLNFPHTGGRELRGAIIIDLVYIFC